MCGLARSLFFSRAGVRRKVIGTKGLTDFIPPDFDFEKTAWAQSPASPHDSRALLLQSRIRGCDRPVGGLARRSVDRHPVQGCLPFLRLQAPGSLRDSAISRRTVM